MDILEVEKKGKHLDALEVFHIFCLYKQDNHFNDNNIDIYNTIFNTVYKYKYYAEQTGHIA
jgi:hypothetical protein